MDVRYFRGHSRIQGKTYLEPWAQGLVEPKGAPRYPNRENATHPAAPDAWHGS